MSDLSNCIFLDGLKIKNFRIFKKETEVPFSKKISLIIGANGLGKTSILDAIDMFCNADLYCNELNYNDFSNNNTNENLECHFHFKTLDKKNWLKKKYKLYEKINSDVFQSPFTNAGHTFGPEDGKLTNFVDEYTKAVPKVIYFGKNRLVKIKNNFNSPMALLFKTLNFLYNKNIERVDNKKDVDLFSESKQFKEEQIINLSKHDGNIGKINIEQLLKDIDKKLGIEFLSKTEPWNNACFVKKEENANIPLSKSGSGFELIIALLLLIKIETKRNKDEKILLLIDEPELSLHPDYQQKLIDELSKLQNTQIILTSHSPTFVKHCMDDKNCEVLICKRDEENSEKIMVKPIKEHIKEKGYKFLENYTNSQAVANFLAFGEYSTDLHNLLYGLLDERDDKSFIDGDLIWYKQITKGEYEKKFKSYEKIQKDDKFYIKENKKSIHYIIRNLIHHPENTNENNLKYKDPPENFKKYLEQSINEMIGLLDSSQGCQTPNQEQKELGTEAQVEHFMQGKI